MKAKPSSDEQLLWLWTNPYFSSCIAPSSFHPRDCIYVRRKYFSGILYCVLVAEFDGKAFFVLVK